MIGTDGAERTVLSITQEFRSGFPVVNLTVEGEHTFAVGPDAVLVHNTAVCNGRRMSAGEALDNGLSIRDEMWPRRGLHQIENHHPLMQGARYRRFWRDRGFTDAEIDNWTVPLDKDIHRAIEESGFWQDELLGEIKAQERLKGGFLTKGEVLGIVDNLLTKISGWSP